MPVRNRIGHGRARLCALAVLAALLLCGCGPTGAPAADIAPADEATAWLRHSDQPVTLSWYVNFSWYATPWNDSLVARTITEETGVSVDFVVPAGNEWEKLSALMNSDSLPDLITLGHWEPQLYAMIDLGLVHPLNELADAYAPYFWQVAHPDRVAWYTQPDGNLYAYPNSSYIPADYERHDNIGSNQAFLVRSDIYGALGSPDMTTPEGFSEAIRAAARLFPEVDGKSLIPIGLYGFDKDGCFSLEDILMNLLAIPYEADGELVDRYTHPDYIAWLKTFRALRAEGYIPDEVFVDRRVQMAEKVSEGRYFCMFYQHTDIADQQIYLYSQNPDSVYIAVDGPKNAAGDNHTLPGVGINGWTVTLISKNSEHPERAIELMSYMMSEHGQKLLFLGIEGETYDLVDGRPAVRAPVLDLLGSDRAAYNRIYGADNTYWMLQDLPMQLDWRPPAAPPLGQPEQWTYPYTAYAAQYEINFGEHAEASLANQRIREAWGETLPQLLLSESDEDFDRLLTDFLARRETLGYEVMQQEANRQVMQAKQRLGLP